ncbi:MFS transporter [Nesterenkonia sp. E16_7]|uniref:MFS transporter n=1 Tax=unclassified Nesterenkonia TaxID=2629769 RepID=UPI001A91D97F|nr:MULTISPECIES: MFS transporter [unclassified Nesterenkonia]MBO0595335.1 MFS transporter [Nesterenkonia sp. E16_10]MBO0599217.1 MFS transporter [Nesterenkonia sp. E16_7]
MLDTDRPTAAPAAGPARGQVPRHSGLGIAVAGMLLIAATYGMARFGVGLFAPRLAAERPELIEVLGWAAAAQFIAYSVAAVIAARLVDRRPRVGLLLAGATATVGSLGVAAASEPMFFIASVVTAGMGGGFASPALVPVIDAVVALRARATAQSVVNTGTGVGVIGAGLVAFLAPSVGSAWAVMAGLSATAAAAVILPLRGHSTLDSGRHPDGNAPRDESSSSKPASSRATRPAWGKLVVPGFAAVVAGIGSALIWTFGPLLVTDSGVVAADQVGWLWIALGAGGLLGTITGVLVTRVGEPVGFSITGAVLAVASGVLAWALLMGSVSGAYASMTIFGAGYMALSGVLILWARRVWPDHAGAGTSMLFIALATGQALGSAGFGLVQGSWDPAVMATAAASLCLIGGGVATIGAWKSRAEK